MNTKRNLGFLVLFGALFVAIGVYAQTAFKADGVVQSTSGGFMFPDGTVQTTAAIPTPTITEYRIVGLTQTKTNGDPSTSDGNGGTVLGVEAMNQLCRNEFGNGARFAFGSERLAPDVAPSTAALRAWINPSDIRLIYDPTRADDSDWYAYEPISGFGEYSENPLQVVKKLNCFQWQTTGLKGLVRDDAGDNVLAACTEVLPVACSAPVQITNTL